MLPSCIFDILDKILPTRDKLKHDISRLEYLSACKIMENEKYIRKILPHLPASITETLLQSVIQNCYLKFINIDDNVFMRICGIGNYILLCLEDIANKMTFPESLRILILNWPHQEFILRNQLPSFHPPRDIFPSPYNELQEQSLCQVEDMITVFRVFCKKLIQFITDAVFECTPVNSQGFSFNLRRLDVSGLGCFLYRYEMLKGIRNSKIDTFGHKIEIIGDTEFSHYSGQTFGQSQEIETLSHITEENVNPVFGISVYFKNVSASLYNTDFLSSSDFYKILAVGKCEYIHISDSENISSFGKRSAKNLRFHLPKLVGIDLRSTGNTESLDFLISLEYLEQISLQINRHKHNDLIHSISNMSKGLKYLNLANCSLHSKDLECLAKSIHSDTLQQLDLTDNHIKNDSEAVGLIMLCQNLTNVKVLLVDRSSLNTLSSSTISKLVNAFKNCIELIFLSMRDNPFSLEITKIIIECLAQKQSLRYLSLDLPRVNNSLCKIFHEKINKYRDSAIYISWSPVEDADSDTEDSNSEDSDSEGINSDSDLQ